VAVLDVASTFLGRFSQRRSGYIAAATDLLHVLMFAMLSEVVGCNATQHLGTLQQTLLRMQTARPNLKRLRFALAKCFAIGSGAAVRCGAKGEAAWRAMPGGTHARRDMISKALLQCAPWHAQPKLRESCRPSHAEIYSSRKSAATAIPQSMQARLNTFRCPSSHFRGSATPGGQ
jgi:hypothetical protein